MNFDIKTEQISDDAYVISLAGEVDLYTAPEFKQQLLEVIGQGGKHVIVDFTSTTFIDSTTLGVLVGGVKRLRTNDGQLSLVCSDRNITKIFEITGLDRVFAIYATRDEAVSNLRRLPTELVTLRRALAITTVLLVALAAAGCGAVGRVGQGDVAHGKELFLADDEQGLVRVVPHARATRAPTGHSGRTSTTRSPPTRRRASPSRRWPTSSAARSRIRKSRCRRTSTAGRTHATSRSTSRSAPR